MNTRNRPFNLFVLLYGVVNYAIFLLVFLYLIGFLGNFLVPYSVDRAGGEVSWPMALIIDAGLIALFGLQHSVMARRGFKAWWTRVVPPQIERSTYLLFTNLVLVLMYWQWKPIPALVWDFQQPAIRMALWGLFAAGWVVILLSTFLINHFDLFGLQQVWSHFRNREISAYRFREPLFYKLVRHPLYVGWIMVFWSAPTMTAGHLLFAFMMTSYILVAIRFEERDLRELHPEYKEYSRRVPMLIPRLRPVAVKAASSPQR